MAALPVLRDRRDLQGKVVVLILNAPMGVTSDIVVIVAVLSLLHITFVVVVVVVVVSDATHHIYWALNTRILKRSPTDSSFSLLYEFIRRCEDRMVVEKVN